MKQLSANIANLPKLIEVLQGNEFFIQKDDKQYEVHILYGKGESEIVTPDIVVVEKPHKANCWKNGTCVEVMTQERNGYRFIFGDKEHNEDRLPCGINFIEVETGNPLKDKSNFVSLVWRERYEIVSILDNNGVVFEHLGNTNTLSAPGFYNCAFLERVMEDGKVVTSKDPVSVYLFGEQYFNLGRSYSYFKKCVFEQMEIEKETQ